MSPTKTELRKQWRMFGNGCIHACWGSIGTSLGSLTIFEGLHALDIVTVKTLWCGVLASVISGFFNGVRGFMQDNQLPDIFATEDTVLTPPPGVNKDVPKD